MRPTYIPTNIQIFFTWAMFKCDGCKRFRAYEDASDHDWCNDCWGLMQTIGQGIALSQGYDL
jgi:hypothetical protein